MLGAQLMCLKDQGGWSGKTEWVGFRRVAQRGLGRASDMERLGKPVQTTVVPYSEALTQIPGLPDRKKISAW